MPTDNVGYDPGTGVKIASRDVTYSGEQAHAQSVNLVTVEGSDDAKVATDVNAANPMPVQEISGGASILRRILDALMSPVGFDRSLGRARSTAVIESGTVTTVSTVTTVTTVSTVTGLTNIDGRNGAMLINATNMSAWYNCHRSRIT
jgi:hypothetical protein